MKNQKRHVQSMLSQLFQMHQQLFGQKYTTGSNINQESQFNKIIQQFRQLIFTIRHTQQQRERQEQKKNYLQSPQSIEMNFLVREDIQRAESILTEAVKRVEGDKKKIKKKVKFGTDQNSKKDKLSSQLIAKKQSILQNCFQLLNDVKQTQQGGVYHPPKQYKTLGEIKKQLIGKEFQQVQEDSINLEEQEFFQQVNKNDQHMDTQLDQIIQGNEKIKGKMIGANEAMGKIQEKVVKVTNKTEQLNERVRKDEKDLLQLLKTYRRPNQLCLDITMVLMVLALIGVIINLIRTL